MTLLLIVIWVIVCFISINLGQYGIDFIDILKALTHELEDKTAQSIILDIRIPRILLSSMCGGILSLCGLCLQAVFKNPLVGPHIVGVSTAAACGGALCILIGFSSKFVVIFAFIFGVIALLLLLLLAKFISKSDIFSLILAGIVINGFFAALISIIQYIADAEEVLPNIIYWLLGSFVNANYDKIIFVLLVSSPCIAILIGIRWRLNLLSLDDLDLKVLGVNINFLRFVILAICTLLTSIQVSVSGNIGWIGLVMPHIARIISGNDHIKSVPNCFIIGAIFMLLIDDLARNMTASEIPLGILSALIGSPIFAILLKKSSSKC